MSDEINAAIVNARCTTALIRAMGMQAENQIRQHRGEQMAYDQAAFETVYLEEGTHWNSVHKVLFE